MEVILRQDVEGLGATGEICNVAAGYARNYLIPNRFAVQVNTQNLKALAHEKRLLEAKELKNKESARETAGVISGLTCKFVRRAGMSRKSRATRCQNFSLSRRLATHKTSKKRKIRLQNAVFLSFSLIFLLQIFILH